MQEDIKVNVVLTKEDIWQFFLGSNTGPMVFSGILFAAIIMPLMIALFGALDFPGDIVFAAVMLALIFFIAAVLLFVVSYTRYRALMSEFENKNFEKAARYEFNLQGCSVGTMQNYLMMRWDDIARLVELRSCFVLMRSYGKFNIIPKRCFNGPAQLSAFVDLITSCVDKRKLKIKRYGFFMFSPDHVTIEPPVLIDDVKKQDNAGEAPLIALRLTLTKKDLLAFNLLFYYTRPGGIVLTALGLLMLGSIALSFGGYDFLIFTRVTQIIMCLLLLVLMPAFICVTSLSAYKLDAVIKKTVTYHFFKDRIVIFNAGGVNNKSFGDFYRLRKLGAYYLFFLSKRMAYIVPERSVEAKTEFARFFEFMKAENRRLNSRAVNSTPASPAYSRFCISCGAARPSPEYRFCPECGKEYIGK